LPTTQVSAHISQETKARLERFVRRSGQTRGRVIEDALLQHLQALEDLPAEALVPARLVLSAESAERVREVITRPPEPTEDMKRLFDDRRDPAPPAR
jgi:predicted DNA-binding protein